MYDNEDDGNNDDDNNDDDDDNNGNDDDNNGNDDSKRVRKYKKTWKRNVSLGEFPILAGGGLKSVGPLWGSQPFRNGLISHEPETSKGHLL